ncbi:MAG: SRPBCC family protein [Candidatus Paracaedibacter sp.]
MWKRSHSRVFKSTEREAIWKCWSDVNSWHEWIPNIECCRLDKPFVTGNHFTLKPKGGSEVTVELLDVQKGHKFTGCTRFFGATLYDTHEMNIDANGIRVTVTLKVTGPLGFLWRKLVAEKIEASLPKLMQNLISLSSSSEKQKTKDRLSSVASKKVTPILSISPTTKGKTMLSTSAVKKAKPTVSSSKPKKANTKATTATVKKKVKPATSAPKLKKVQTKASTSTVKKIKTSTPAVKKPKLTTSTLKPKKAKTKASTSPSALKKPKTKTSATKPKPTATKSASKAKKS